VILRTGILGEALILNHAARRVDEEEVEGVVKIDLYLA